MLDKVDEKELQTARELLALIKSAATSKQLDIRLHKGIVLDNVERLAIEGIENPPELCVVIDCEVDGKTCRMLMGLIGQDDALPAAEGDDMVTVSFLPLAILPNLGMNLAPMVPNMAMAKVKDGKVEKIVTASTGSASEPKTGLYL